MSVDSQLLREGDEQLSRILDQLSEARGALLAAKTKVVEATRSVDPFPLRYVGVVDNYRFTTGAKGQVPTHRFEVICGNGLFLHVEATPDQFSAMMVEMTMGDITPSKVKDKLVIVERNREAGMVPRLMIDKPTLAGAQDAWGNWLWEGAAVVNKEYSLSGTIVSDAVEESELGAIVMVNFEDGSGQLRRYANELIVQL